MITFLSFASKKQENDLIRERISYQAARWTDEAWQYEMFDQLRQVEEYLLKEHVLDLLSWDVSVKDSIATLEQMRKHYQQQFLLVIAETGISPMTYLRPAISPSSLLLKPITQDNLKMVLDELVEAFSRKFDQNEGLDSFVIETRDGKQYIPFSQIYYVEAREKKVFIRTRQEEYGFYETIEHMIDQLPEEFCRCHRSYIVNMTKVHTVKASLNMIELHGELSVPLSRSFKKTIKEYHKHA